MKSYPRHSLRWLISTAALVAMPKCALCIFGWLAVLVGARVELCGEAPPSVNAFQVAVVVACVGPGGIFIFAAKRRRRRMST